MALPMNAQRIPAFKIFFDEQPVETVTETGKYFLLRKSFSTFLKIPAL
jgi:hypothetical protein